MSWQVLGKKKSARKDILPCSSGKSLKSITRLFLLMKGLCQKEVDNKYWGLQKVAPSVIFTALIKTCPQNVFFIPLPIFARRDGPNFKSWVTVRILYVAAMLLNKMLGQYDSVVRSLLSHDILNEVQHCSILGMPRPPSFSGSFVSWRHTFSDPFFHKNL